MKVNIDNKKDASDFENIEAEITAELKKRETKVLQEYSKIKGKAL